MEQDQNSRESGAQDAFPPVNKQEEPPRYQQAPPPPPYYPPPQRPLGSYPPFYPEKPRRSFLGRVFRSLMVIILLFSLALNVYLGAYLALTLNRGVEEHTWAQGKDKMNRIALIDLQGSINMETAAQMRRMLREAERDQTVKGVILVVNSPGGEVVPSDMINRYISDFSKKTKKPVWSAIEQVGASGAYWISAATNRIYAQENAMIGSIGVIYLNMVVKNTMDKIGVDPIVIKSTKAQFKDRGSPFRYPSDEDKTEITADLDAIHKRFVEVVLKGRQGLITQDKVWGLANGEVWDGPESLERSLIDKVGFLEDAIADMKTILKIDDPVIIQYSRPARFSDIFARSSAFENPLNIQEQLRKFASSPRIMAIWLGE